MTFARRRAGQIRGGFAAVPWTFLLAQMRIEKRGDRLERLSCLGSRRINQILSSTFSIFHPRGRQVITQKISSWAMKRSASSIDKTVRPNGPVEAHRSFQSDQ